MKKAVSILLLLIMSLSLVASAATTDIYTDASYDFSLSQSVAADLKELNLFKGVSDADFDLDRAPTRVEALVMLVRLLGKEDAALNGNFSHPFTDVPTWADKYVAYAYSTGLTKGVSATKFGSGNATSAMYFTFVLRALGYTDGSGKDFTWDNPFDLALETQIQPISVDTKNFMRSDVVMVSYAALSAAMKGSSSTLADKLVSEKVFTVEEFSYIYDKLKVTSPEETFVYNRTLRDFIATFGKYEAVPDGDIVLHTYYLPLYSEDGSFRYVLSYSASTGVLSATEESFTDSETPVFSTAICFAGMGTAKDSMKAIVSINDGNAQIVAAAFLHPENYTYLAPLDFYAWRPTTETTSATYTQEKSEATAGEFASDIIETTEYLFSEYYLGFSMINYGFSKFFN